MVNLPKLRALVVVGVPLTRFALVSLTNLHPRYEVCAQAQTAPEARERCVEHRPDVVVLDLAIAAGEGPLLLRDFRRAIRAVRSLVVGESGDARSVQRAFRAGAGACLCWGDDVGEFVEALECVAAGKVFASRHVASLLLRSLGAGRVGLDRELEQLSDRELQIFQLSGKKLGPSEIASALHISVKTVETHTQRIKEKLGVASCAELRRRAMVVVDRRA